MPKQKTITNRVPGNARIFTRERGGVVRYYGDFRPYAKEGGKYEALTPPGRSVATSDADVARSLYVARHADLERKRRAIDYLGEDDAETEREKAEAAKRRRLKAYAREHLIQKARDGASTSRWLVSVERHLTDAVEHFGPDRDIATIGTGDCTRWVNHLRTVESGRGGGKLTDSTIRKYLNSLSNLYRRAVGAEDVAVERNPVADMFVKPTEATREAPFLEAHEAALLLESARTYVPRVEDGAYPWIYALLATFMLTGGRKSEVLGLEVDDLSLRHRKIYFRPNDWRRLKSKGSKRSVPLWPQLEEILREYLVEREQDGGLGSLLFPSCRGSGERMITDVRKALDHIGERAGFPKGHVRLHMLRHTYTAARIQTCDRGLPVALYTSARELGHKSTDMLEDRYAHLHERTKEGGTEVVEFRVENHAKELVERLAAIGGGDAEQA